MPIPELSKLFMRLWELTHPEVLARGEFILYEPPLNFSPAAERYVLELQVIERQLMLGQPIPDQRTSLSKRRRRLLGLMAAFEAGYDPSTPPNDWYVGRVTEEQPETYDSWPCRHGGSYGNNIFQGILPVFAQEAYLKAVALLGRSNIRLYAEQGENFQGAMPITNGSGKMALYGRSSLGGKAAAFFHILTWDSVQDLEGVRGLLAERVSTPE